MAWNDENRFRHLQLEKVHVAADLIQNKGREKELRPPRYKCRPELEHLVGLLLCNPATALWAAFLRLRPLALNQKDLFDSWFIFKADSYAQVMSQIVGQNSAAVHHKIV